MSEKERSEALQEAGRVMTICNSCRYCEGFCAVFPAMELRRTFTDGDLKYLSNLCHNCRDCYYACQFAPPHEYNLNFPQAMADLRGETYREFVWPGFLAPLFKRNGLTIFLTTLFSVLAVYIFARMKENGVENILGTWTGDGSFYNIIPEHEMLIAFSIVALWALIAFTGGIYKFWKTINPTGEQFFSGSGNKGALMDVLRLKYLEGGSYGCNYPDEEFSMSRRYMHHLIFYGFLSCLASTTIAAIMDHVLGMPAPYSWYSLPVVLGTLGGISIIIGLIGMIYLKTNQDRRPLAADGMVMDYGFLILLLLVNITGLALLFVRDTPLMGSLLILHLGVVLAFFLTLPCGKFVHAIYRYVALVRHNQEQANRE
jgi:citrate/tricarballylate utilization protein